MKQLFFASILLCAFTVKAQKVNRTLHFTKGQRLEVVTNTTINAESMMGPTAGTMTAADTYTVTEATEKTTTLLKVPKQLKLNFRMGSQEMKVDSDNPKDLDGMLGDPVKDIMSRKPEFTIDAAGTVIAVKNAPKKNEEVARSGITAAMLPGLDFTASMPEVGNPSIFQVLPGREVVASDTWTDSLDETGNKSVTVYRVKEINEKEIVVEFNGEGTTTSSQEAMGTKVDVNANFRTTGTMIIDKASGLLKQKQSTNTTETAMNFGGQAINTTMKTTTVTTVTQM